MISYKRLISFGMCGRIDVTSLSRRSPKWLFAESSLDPIVNCKVNGPSREVADDGGAKSAVESSKAVPPQNGDDST